jgi:hypothetical protein
MGKNQEKYFFCLTFQSGTLESLFAVYIGPDPNVSAAGSAHRGGYRRCRFYPLGRRAPGQRGRGLPTANLSMPPISSGVVFLPIAKNVDPSSSIPADLQIGADGNLTVPVNIDDPHPEAAPA